MGITEAAIFGVNLRYRKPFIGAAIGGAAAGAYVVATKVQMTAVGVTALPAIAITTSDTMLNYCIGLVIAGAVSFIIGCCFFTSSQISGSKFTMSPAPTVSSTSKLRF